MKSDKKSKAGILKKEKNKSDTSLKLAFLETSENTRSRSKTLGSSRMAIGKTAEALIDDDRQLRKYIRSPMSDDSDDETPETNSSTPTNRKGFTHRRFKSEAPSRIMRRRSKSYSPTDKRVSTDFDMSSLVGKFGSDDVATIVDTDSSLPPPITPVQAISYAEVAKGKRAKNKQVEETKNNKGGKGKSPLVESLTAEELYEKNSLDEVLDSYTNSNGKNASPGIGRLKAFKFPIDDEEKEAEPENVNIKDEEVNDIAESVQEELKPPQPAYSDIHPFQTQIYQDQWSVPPQYNYQTINAQQVNKNVYYETTDSEDDTMSVLEEAFNEEDKRNTETYELNNSSNIKFFTKWTWKFIKYILYIAFFMAPSLVCEIHKDKRWEFCSIYGTPVLRFSIMFSIASFGIFFSDLVVMCIMVIIKKTPYLGAQFLYYVTNLSKPLKWALVTMIVYIAWNQIFDNTPVLVQQGFGETVSKIFACFFATAFGFLGKAIFMRFLAIRFHRAAYYKRVKNALFAEYVFTNLLSKTKKGFMRQRNPLLANTFKTVKKYVKRSKRRADPEEGVVSDKEAHRESRFSWTSDVGSSSWNPLKTTNEEYLFDTVPVTEAELLDKRTISNHKLAVFVEFIKMSGLDFTKGVFKGCILRMHQMDNCLRPQDYVRGESGELVLDMSQSHAARIIAKFLFQKLKQPGAHEVNPEDFQPFMFPGASYMAFCLFDGNWDGSLSEKEIYSTLLSIARERKALRTALNDAESAIDRLNAAVTFGLWVVLAIGYVIIFTENVEKTLTTFSQFLLAIAFAIGNSVKALLESIIFIFVRHPYDIGDRVVINKVVHVITKVSLLTTETRRYDNAVFYFNNADLSSLPILNLRRSPDQFDLITLQIAFNTPTPSLRAMESKIADYLNKRSSHFYPKFEMEYKEIENSNRLVMCLRVQHRGNFQNIKRYRQRRGKLVLRLKKICEELSISYDLPDQKVVHEGYWDPTPTIAPGSIDSGIPNLPQSTIPRSIPDDLQSTNDGKSQRMYPQGTHFSRQPQQQYVPLRKAPPGYNTMYGFISDSISDYGMASSLKSEPQSIQTGPQMPPIPEGDQVRYQDGWFQEPSPYEPVMAPIEKDVINQVMDEKEDEAFNSHIKKTRNKRNNG